MLDPIEALQYELEEEPEVEPTPDLVGLSLPHGWFLLHSPRKPLPRHGTGFVT
jgi:hypothetical protein